MPGDYVFFAQKVIKKIPHKISSNVNIKVERNNVTDKVFCNILSRHCFHNIILVHYIKSCEFNQISAKNMASTEMTNVHIHKDNMKVHSLKPMNRLS